MKKLLFIILCFSLNVGVYNNLHAAGDNEEDVLIGNIRSSVYAIFNEVYGDLSERDQETGEEKKIFDAIFSDVWETSLVNEIKQNFTVDDLKKLDDYFKTPEFKKFLKLFPQMGTEIEKSVGYLMNKSYPPAKEIKISKSYNAIVENYLKKTEKKLRGKLDKAMESLSFMLKGLTDEERQFEKEKFFNHFQNASAYLYTNNFTEEEFKKIADFDLSEIGERFEKVTDKASETIGDKIKEIFLAEKEARQ